MEFGVVFQDMCFKMLVVVVVMGWNGERLGCVRLGLGWIDGW